MRTFAQKQNRPQERASSSRARSNTAAPGLHRAGPTVRLQRANGDQAFQGMLQTDAQELEAGSTGTLSPRFGYGFGRISIHPPTAGAIQTKLAINQPGDIYEQEADCVSEQILRMPEPQLYSASAIAGAHPKDQAEQPGQEHERLQTKRLQTGNLGQTAAPPIVHEVLASPGQPLEAATRAFMEPRFGHDFSQVRIHNHARAAQSARSINALAYTVGQSVIMGAGEYAPGTSKGDRLLAHELAHVVQQHPSDVSGFRPSYRAPTMVYRQAGPGGNGSQGRIVYLETDVLSQIAGGNKPMADALQAMRASGTDVRITRYNYTEATHGAPVSAGARKFIVQELVIKIDEGGGLASRKATYERLADKPVMVQPKDVPMIAAVRAAGPNAELWSLDGGVKSNVKQFGVKLAPESWLPSLKTPLDVRAGLNNVGLHAWDIASDGTPIRRPVLAGTGVPSGKGTSGPKGGLASKTVPPAPVDPPARTVKGEIETKGTPSAPPTAPPQPSPAAPAAVPTVGSVGQKPPVVSSRDLAAELVRTETQVRRMELFTKAAWYSLGAWSAKNALEDVARAVNMAAATFAQGSPFEKEIQHARALESTAREVQEYYASLDIFKNQMPSKGDPEWNSWYDVQQAQLNYLWIEIPLHDALKSVKEARSNLEAQIRSLNDAMAWRVTALVMLPTTSLVYAEAALFAGAGRKIGGSLLTARGSYLDAQRSIEHLGRLARSAAKVLELRLRQLGTTGSFHGMSLDEVRSSSQEKFTSR